MFAYDIERSRLGNYGFDSLNLFTNDDIFFTGFKPVEEDIEAMGRFIKELNFLFFSSEPSRLYVNKIESVFVGNIKISTAGGYFMAEGRGESVKDLLSNLRQKLLVSVAY